MGLFSALKSIVKAVPLVGSVVSAIDSKHAVGKANTAIQAGITNAKGDLNSQLATTTQAYDPYTSNGALAVNREGDILGLHGNDAQTSAISGVHDSPLYKALFGSGQDAVLSSASATGGLRGGNVNEALARNGETAFASTLQSLLQSLGGLSSQGLSATGQLGAFGAQNAGSLAQLDTGSGQANAGSILGKMQIDNNLFGGLRQQVQQAVTAGAGGAPGGVGGGGGFDFSSALKSLFTPKTNGTSPLQSVAGGGTSNSVGSTGYTF